MIKIMDWTQIIITILTSISSVIVALITAGYFKRKQEKTKEIASKKQLMKQIQHDEIIHYALRELRRKYNADRVYIWQFHNGGNFYTTSPMQRTSITYERCSEGLERKAEKYQGVLISNFTNYIKSTMDGNMYNYNVDSIPDFALRALILSHGTFAHAATPLFDKENHLIGIVCLDWVFSEIGEEYLLNNNFTEDFKNILKQESSSLTVYL
jgi:hypothetical protein